MCRQKKGPYVDMHFEMHITAFRDLLEGDHVAANPATLNSRTDLPLRTK